MEVSASSSDSASHRVNAPPPPPFPQFFLDPQTTTTTYSLLLKVRKQPPAINLSRTITNNHAKHPSIPHRPRSSPRVSISPLQLHICSSSPSPSPFHLFQVQSLNMLFSLSDCRGIALSVIFTADSNSVLCLHLDVLQALFRMRVVLCSADSRNFKLIW